MIRYYETAGFDLEQYPFEILAVEFMQQYRKEIPAADLHPGIQDVLSCFHSLGIRQVVLSAMEQGLLEDLVDAKNLRPYFSQIKGISNDLAYGKNDVAHELFRKLDIVPQEACMIGDTLHDLDVADSLGIACILVGFGHQSYHRLTGRHPAVVRHPLEILRIFNKKQK